MKITVTEVGSNVFLELSFGQLLSLLESSDHLVSFDSFDLSGLMILAVHGL